ncbi:hypothetical protein [Providencia rustigianii]|uniref:Uncharacterized protein n=1 Tax=Providencia rustigianii TaxID=158850 RepID=A0A379G4M2_9GAMM|nr:hypothetical protein [Providencia rustigianii]SPY77874.1 Uncharacterised protein [Providencia rustigianii]SUC35918.1 Uncharacterised protein [Providencia rustigianii]
MSKFRSYLQVWCIGLLIFIGSIPSTMAGDPGPYRLVFLDISESPYQDGQKLLIELRKLERLSSVQRDGCFICNGIDDGESEVEVLYLYSIPVGLSVDELRKAVNGDDISRNKMQMVLRDFKDQYDFGVDGLLIYKHEEGKVTIYTMDNKVGSKLLPESKSVKSKLLHSSLDMLLEKSANKLDRPV